MPRHSSKQIYFAPRLHGLYLRSVSVFKPFLIPFALLEFSAFLGMPVHLCGLFFLRRGFYTHKFTEERVTLKIAFFLKCCERYKRSYEKQSDCAQHYCRNSARSRPVHRVAAVVAANVGRR